MDAEELAFAGLARQAELVREREVSSRELVETCLERIERLDGRLNAFKEVWADEALTGAKSVDRKRKPPEGQPLRGVPVAIKDEFDVAGKLVGHGTDAFRTPATEDAPVVAGLRASGAIFIGQTNMPEFGALPHTASLTHGVTRNPWDHGRMPGGSSGGSAVAVATGMVAGALGGDGGGSIRVPASACGVFGLKPQRGRLKITPEGEPEPWHGLVVSGPLTRSVADAALFMAAATGDASYSQAAAAPAGALRVAVSFKPPVLTAKLDPEVRGAVQQVADALANLGHHVREADPDYGELTPYLLLPYLSGVRRDVEESEAPERLERRTRGLAGLGRLVRAESVDRVRYSGQFGDRFDRIQRVFVDHDVVLTPSLAAPPPPLNAWDGLGPIRTMLEVTRFIPYSPPWNITGQPAASVPAGFSTDGLPIGAQLVGRPEAESTLLSLSAQLEGELGWTELRPPGASGPGG